MQNILLIQLINKKATVLLHEREELHLIKILKEDIAPPKIRLSDKYRGVFIKQDALSFEQHIKSIREEWDDR